jgi:hypothetical protein
MSIIYGNPQWVKVRAQAEKPLAVELITYET